MTETPRLDVSVILLLFEMEAVVASMVGDVAAILREVERAPPLDAPKFEILALDERSSDNTLSVLSMLVVKTPQLQIVPDLRPGTALPLGVRTARGRICMFCDRPVVAQTARTCLESVLGGQPAAAIPGEILVTSREVAAKYLTLQRGGLVRAQQLVTRGLHRDGKEILLIPSRNQSPRSKAHLFLRQRLTRLGLSRFDRPHKPE